MSGLQFLGWVAILAVLRNRALRLDDATEVAWSYDGRALIIRDGSSAFGIFAERFEEITQVGIVPDEPFFDFAEISRSGS